jgi:hypothetical protein
MQRFLAFNCHAEITSRMKNAIIITLASLNLLFASKAFAQVAKGQWLIGGNAAFSYEKTNYEKTSSFQLLPDAGYFFFDKLAGGLRLGFGSETHSNSRTQTYKYRLTNVLAAPFARYYFLSSEQKVNILADVAYGFGYFTDKDLTPSPYPAYKHRYHVFSLMAGPAIFLNEHTALEITFGYSHSTGVPPPTYFDTTTVSRFQVGVGLQIHLGRNKE